MKVKPSALTIDILGEVVGLILAPRGVSVIARAAYKERRRSPDQVLWSAAFRTADFAWQQLSPERRTAWRAWKPWYRQTGYQLFMRCNIRRAHDGQPLLLDPPDYPPWV